MIGTEKANGVSPAIVTSPTRGRPAHRGASLALAAGLMLGVLPGLGSAAAPRPSEVAGAGVEQARVSARSTPGAIVRVSTTATGKQTRNLWPYSPPVFSPDGKRVALTSWATTLVPGDTNGRQDVFVKTLASGAIRRVSTTAGGKQGQDDSGGPVFSPDAKKVAFTSFAPNLVPGDTNGRQDVFVKTLASGAIRRVSTTASGEQGDGGGAEPDYSPDGRRLAFVSGSANLVPGDTNGAADIFVKTLATGAIQLVSAAPDGAQANGESNEPAFSPDGQQIAFSSWATNLVPGDTNGGSDIFITTLATGAIQRVSTSVDGTQAVGHDPDDAEETEHPVFSPDGGRLLFTSKADNLVPGDTNGSYDVFVKDLSTGRIVRASTTASDEQANGGSNYPSVSPDGTRVAFASEANNLVAGDTVASDLFVKTLLQTPSAPRSVTGTTLDGQIVVAWRAPRSTGGTPITGYTATARPGGATCTSGGELTCTITGLANATAYRVRVTAENKVGISPTSTRSRRLRPAAHTVTAQPVRRGSRLRINVDPDRGHGYWTFQVEQETAATWTTLPGTHRTRAKSEIRTLNLPAGTYRVTVTPKYGYPALTSAPATLTR